MKKWFEMPDTTMAPGTWIPEAIEAARLPSPRSDRTVPWDWVSNQVASLLFRDSAPGCPALCHLPRRERFATEARGGERGQQARRQAKGHPASVRLLELGWMVLVLRPWRRRASRRPEQRRASERQRSAQRPCWRRQRRAWRPFPWPASPAWVRLP